MILYTHFLSPPICSRNRLYALLFRILRLGRVEQASARNGQARRGAAALCAHGFVALAPPLDGVPEAQVLRRYAVRLRRKHNQLAFVHRDGWDLVGFATLCASTVLASETEGKREKKNVPEDKLPDNEELRTGR